MPVGGASGNSGSRSSSSSSRSSSSRSSTSSRSTNTKSASTKTKSTQTKTLSSKQPTAKGYPTKDAFHLPTCEVTKVKGGSTGSGTGISNNECSFEPAKDRTYSI